MSDPSIPLRGRCLCGAVRFTLAGERRGVIDCHCHRCRRWTGHHMAATSARNDDVVIEDDEHTLTWFAVPEAEYGFCSRCGSSLFWRASSSPAWLSVCAGVLDPPTGLRTVEAWWVSEASDYHPRPELPERATE